MIDTISFKNFRKFGDFPTLKLGGITVLVGGNNAGKTTLAKVLDFVIDNLTHASKKTLMKRTINGNANDFLFNLKVFGDYNRTHNKHTLDPLELKFALGKSEFLHSNGRYEVTIRFEHADLEDREISLCHLCVEDKELLIKYTFSNQSSKIEWVDFFDKDIIVVDDEECIKNYQLFEERHSRCQTIDIFIYDQKRIIQTSSIEDQINGTLDSVERGYIINSTERFKRLQEAYGDTGYNNEEYTYSHYDPDVPETTLIIPSTFEGAFELAGSDKGAKEWQSLQARMKQSLKEFEESIMALHSLQLPIHSLEKTIVFSASHPMHRLIRDYITKENEVIPQLKNGHLSIHSDKQRYKDLFVEFLQDFDLAKDYRIKTIGGEVYTFELLDKHECWVHIADIGTGALRLIEIFLFLLTAKRNSVLFIEEPEQNLHPCFQSKLADLFLKSKESLNYDIIIETHSEYFIRRAQVLVAEKKYTSEELEKINPFKVYYFPKDELPYKMKFLRSGRFDNSFGKGFFDEASISSLTLSRLEKRNKNDWN